MAITTDAPVPRAPISESQKNPDTGEPGQYITLPYSIFLRNLRNDINNAPLNVPGGIVSQEGQAAAVLTTDLTTPAVTGLFAFEYYAEVTSADAASSLTPVLGWSSHGLARTETLSTMPGAATATSASERYMIYADANTPITYALTYPAGTMVYNFYAVLSSVSGV